MAAIAALPCALKADDTLSINPSTTYQTIDGWVGVLGAQLSSFQTTEMINRAVNQLGLTSFRMDQPFSGNGPSGTSWQSTINGIDPSNANWGTLDQLPGINTAAADNLMTTWVLPLKAAVQAQNEPFTLTTNPSWYNGGSTGVLPTWMQYNPGAYAEVLVSFDEYLRDKYGITPTFSTIINEAGNNNNMTPVLEAQVIEAMGPMLKAAGLSTQIDLGSGVGPNVAEQYATSPSMTPQVWQYVGAIAYHNYEGTSADKVALAATAASHGVVTMQNETDLATYNTMYDDLTNGDVSYWGNYGIGGYAAGAGIQYLNAGVDGASFSVPSQYWNYREVMYYVRPGAVRIGAADSNANIQPMAFRQTSGPFAGTTVVMGNIASGATTQIEDLSGLAPNGKYGISYAKGLSSGQMLTEQGIQTASSTGALNVTVPANAVLTVYPYSGIDAPEIYNDSANPTYLLKGSGSSTSLTVSATSPELSNLSYNWSVASEPTGAAATVSNTASASTTANGLTVPGLYTFNINVSDTSAAGVKFTSADQVAINVFSSIPAPIVQAVQSRSPLGQNLNYPLILTQPQSSVSLLDQIYYDLKDGTTGIYNWSVVSAPNGANVSLSQPNTNNCLASGLTAAGNYVFQLIASDTSGNNVTQDVNVTVDPSPTSAPSINGAKGTAGTPGQGSLSATVADPGNYNVSWWQVLSQPANSNVTFDNEASPNTNFYVTAPGTYTFQLDTVDETQYAQTPVTGSGLITVTISSMPKLSWNKTGGSGDGQTWDVGGNQNWNNGSGPSVYTDGSNVTFNDSNGGNYAVTLNTTVSPGSVTVNNTSGNYAISGSGTIAGTGSLTKMGSGLLTLSSINTYTGGTNVNAGTLIIGANGALPDNAVSITGGTLQLAPNTGTAQITSLAIAPGGTLDINNNRIIIHYGSGPDPIASIAAYISSGFGTGPWNGSGITSTAAQSNFGSYGIGYADSTDPGNPAGLPPGSIEIMYTLLGDTNLDGEVNGVDFAILAANFNQGGRSWDQGDFNYDGDVNGSDFAMLAENFNKGATQSADLIALDSFAAANGLSADVPDPVSAGILAIAGLGILGRRHRYHTDSLLRIRH